RALGEQENPAGFSVEPMDMTKELQIPGPGPELTGRDRGRDGGLQVARRPLPRVRNQHPTRRLVDRQHRAVFVENRDRGAISQLNMIRGGHNAMMAWLRLSPRRFLSRLPLPSILSLGQPEETSQLAPLPFGRTPGAFRSGPHGSELVLFQFFVF